MGFSALLVLHIGSGIVGCFAGAAAISLRKGARRHAVAGTVFAVSMLSLAASGVYLAVVKSQPGTVPGGVLTFYLVATAWMTARRKAEETAIFGWAALLVALALGAVTTTWGMDAASSPTGLKHDYPAGPYFFLASVAVLAAIGDVRWLRGKGISGAQRIARHLWRMCFALFIASSSIFLARQHLFPALLRKTGVLFLLSFLPLLLMIFWLVRLRLGRAPKERVVGGSLSSPQAIETRSICR
jgi:uncharacterized membrane protein